MKRFRLRSVLVPWVITALLMAVSGDAGTAQSGRRIPKRTEPAPAPPSQPPPEQPADKAEKPKLSVLVAYNSVPSSLAVDFYYGTALDGCAGRLREAYVHVIMGKDINRKEAHDRAKASSDTYVVWIELSADSFGAAPNEVHEDPSRLFIYYTLLTPATAKIKSQGRVYLWEMMKAGDVGIGLPTPTTPASVDYYVRKGGREVGARVLNALGLVTPPGRLQ